MVERNTPRTRITGAETGRAAGNGQAVATTLGDGALAELASQRSELEARLGTAEQGGQTAIDLQAELDAIDADLAAQSGATLRVLQEDLTTITSRETEARDQLRSLLLESDMSAEMLAELFNLQQGATAARNQYQTLLAREQDLGALANLQIAAARVVSEALPPQPPPSPNTRTATSQPEHRRTPHATHPESTVPPTLKTPPHNQPYIHPNADITTVLGIGSTTSDSRSANPAAHAHTPNPSIHAREPSRLNAFSKDSPQTTTGNPISTTNAPHRPSNRPTTTPNPSCNNSQHHRFHPDPHHSHPTDTHH